MKKIKKSPKNRYWIGLLLFQVGVFYIFSKWSFPITIVENLFELKKVPFQWVFSRIPFSVGDVGYFLLGCFLAYSFWKIIVSKDRKIYSVRLFKWLNVFYFIYQVFWGMTYFQKPIIFYLDEKPPTQDELKSLAIKYLYLAKNTRVSVQEDEQGIFKINDWASVERHILQKQNKLPSIIYPKKGTKIPNFKPSLYSSVMNYTGILGYYNPFTTEAQYNEHLPHTMLPFTLAHESAHQLGYAREQEANFIAYLLAENTQNIELKYSVEYYVLKSLLNAIAQEDEIFVKSILSQYSEAMKRDRQAERTFFEEHQGVLNDVFAFTNDWFLKSNQQEGSITYSYFVDLLVRYERNK